MPTKKDKAPAKKVAVSKNKVIKKEVLQPVAKLISYTIKATIPTMGFGNIMPEISVAAETIDDAHDFCMPYIEHLYEVYAEDPRDGKKIKFLQEAQVTVQERIVPPTSPVIPLGQAQGAQTTPPPAAAPVTIGSAPNAPIVNKPISFEQNGSIIHPQGNPFALEAQNPIEKSIHYQNAENAVHNSFTIEALDLVQSQITASVKLDGNEKNHLYTLVLKKRTELNQKL